jgi:hypothetical protein
MATATQDFGRPAWLPVDMWWSTSEVPLGLYDAEL